MSLPLGLCVLLVACGSSGSSSSGSSSSGSSSSGSSAAGSSASSGSSGSAPATDAAPLAVTSLDPATGATDGGTFVVVTGTRFMADGPRHVKVYFGSRQGAVVRFESDSKLVVQAPGGKRDETVDVTVVFDPGGPITLPKAFTFVEKSW